MSKRMGPGDVPGPTPARTRTVDTPPDDGGDPVRIPEFQGEYELSLGEIKSELDRLREPFPEDRIEHLPKPMWKGAWDGLKGSNCPTCHGYHVLQHCIHLDYVGHANVTDRLLEVDPFWSWEPMAQTADGLPLFSKEGLWIRLTVCGVTRIGFGDGNSIKEVIGDAIRNAAMRFGVGLNLWAKIDLHAERNPGDGKAPQNRRPASGGAARGRGPAASEPTRAPNQDALDALLEVCSEHGYSTEWAAERFEQEHGVRVVIGHPDDIMVFAAKLIEQATAEGVDASGGGGTEAAVGEGDDGRDTDVHAGDEADEAQQGGGDSDSADEDDLF